MQIPLTLRAPLSAVASALLITCGAWGIESYGLTSAVATEAQTRARYEESRLEVSRMKVLYARVDRLTAVARHVRDIQVSGDRHAALFADIGNRLSAHVWLTAISDDETGVAMAGKAGDFSALSRTIKSLSAPGRYAPVLVHATREVRQGRSEPLRYDIHLDGVR